MSKITLTEIMKGAWKERSIATCEERGIPQFADGLKPVQRFLLCQGYKTAKNKFDKVAAISGSIAALGYAHGEQSAAGALTSMGAYFSNNLPLFEGDGNFGNVLNPAPAASRYIFAKLAPYIDLIFKDMELAPKHPDPEIVPPLYYLPIIPLCLVNGIKGIATGYAVDIPPHDPVSIIDELIRYCDGKKAKGITPKYYFFGGDIQKDGDHYSLSAKVIQKSPIHFVVTELPPIFNTSASYESFLRKLLDKGTIQSYENNSVDDKFSFDIWIKKGSRWSEEDIIKNLKLTNNHTWNLTTIMPDGKLHVWSKETGIDDIMREFYNFRIPFVQKRIAVKLGELCEQEAYLAGLIQFMEKVVSGKLKLKDMEEDALRTILKETFKIPDSYVEKVLNMPLRAFTASRIADSKKKLEDVREMIKHYQSTTKEAEFKKDLEELKKAVKAYQKEMGM